MLLSDRDILAAQKDGHISLDPWTPEMVQPASIDVRLDRFFRLFNNHAYTYVDPAENQGALTEQFDVAPDEPWILHPGEFALGSTWEYVKLDATVAARLEGKSSLGRLGILTHSTAGFIDPGFEGHITLDKQYLVFGKAFEAEFVGQSETENRSIIETLDKGWELLGLLPREELDRIDTKVLDQYYRETVR